MSIKEKTNIRHETTKHTLEYTERNCFSFILPPSTHSLSHDLFLEMQGRRILLPLKEPNCMVWIKKVWRRIKESIDKLPEIRLTNSRKQHFSLSIFDRIFNSIRGRQSYSKTLSLSLFDHSILVSLPLLDPVHAHESAWRRSKSVSNKGIKSSVLLDTCLEFLLRMKRKKKWSSNEQVDYSLDHESWLNLFISLSLSWRSFNIFLPLMPLVHDVRSCRKDEIKRKRDGECEWIPWINLNTQLSNKTDFDDPYIIVTNTSIGMGNKEKVWGEKYERRKERFKEGRKSFSCYYLYSISCCVFHKNLNPFSLFCS